MNFSTRRLVQVLWQSRLLHSVELRPEMNFKLSNLKEIIQSDLKVISLLKTKRSITSNDWEDTRKNILKFPFINEKNVDATIWDLCLNLDNGDAFMSYIEFLKRNNYELNLYIIGNYVATISKKDNLTDSEKEYICSLYDKTRKKYSILDGNSCEKFIYALCQTDRWEDAIELIDMIKITKPISSSALSPIIASAFYHGKVDIGWKYLNLGEEENIVFFLPKVYASYLEYCLKTYKDKTALEENLLKMFYFSKETNKLLFEKVLDDYLIVFKNLGYTHDRTSISPQGKCIKCSHQLTAVGISKEEFEEMSKVFMENVVVRGNVYYNSSPTEFKRFMNFLENAKPYDIVIDGLNAAYCGTKKSNKDRAHRLATIVEYFLSKKKKILLLGRKHMLRWENMNFIRLNSQMFLVDNDSSDDPHLLYATLYGGLKTCFFSMDLMRQHKRLLPIPMKKLFKKWQMSHQYMLDVKTLVVKNPVKFEINMHEDENGWHIPYYERPAIVKDSYDLTTNWICLRKRST